MGIALSFGYIIALQAEPNECVFILVVFRLDLINVCLFQYEIGNKYTNCGKIMHFELLNAYMKKCIELFKRDVAISVNKTEFYCKNNFI